MTTEKGCTLISFDFFPRLFRVLVNEAFVPSIWVPPSTVRMLLAYPSIVSEYASEHLVPYHHSNARTGCQQFAKFYPM